MCGIAGYIRTVRPPAAPTPPRGPSRRMTRALRHRGPDDEGLTLLDRATGAAADLSTDATAPGVRAACPGRRPPRPVRHDVAFGQCRFSIVDLSPAGHQPFWSADRQVCVTFNGEIYNHVELRRELTRLGHAFRSECDTEVLVEAYRRWGTDCFTPVRRVLGGRPVRRREPGGAAEPRPRRQGAAVRRPPRRRALVRVGDPGHPGRHRPGGVPRPRAGGGRLHGPRLARRPPPDVLRGDRVVPRRLLRLGPARRERTSPQEYWRLPARAADRAASSRRTRRRPSSAGGWRTRSSVRMRADVPVGFELSGGLDSSCLVAAARLGAAAGSTPTPSRSPAPTPTRSPTPGSSATATRDAVDYTVLRPPADDFWRQADEYVGRHRRAVPRPQPPDQPRRLARHGRPGHPRQHQRRRRRRVLGRVLQRLLRAVPPPPRPPRATLGHLLRNCRLFGQAPHAPWSATFLRRLAGALRQGAAPTPAAGAYLTSSFGSRPYPLPAELNPLRLPAPRPPAPRPSWSRCSSITWAPGG